MGSGENNSPPAPLLRREGSEKIRRQVSDFSRKMDKMGLNGQNGQAEDGKVESSDNPSPTLPF